MAGKVIVGGTAAGGYTQRINTGSHTLTADEPLDVGGRDQGPTPYELLLSALGSCTAITLRLYAAHKQWPLEDVVVELDHDRIHAEDCADCETATGLLDRIRTRVTVTGPLDEDQVARLREIAVRCPVHRTLAGEITFDDSLVLTTSVPA